MRLECICIFLFSLFLIGSAFAFDGNRDGFVLGGGGGLAPFVKIGEADNKTGLGAVIFCGAGWDEKNLLLFISDVSFISDEENYRLGYIGMTYARFFQPTEKSSFIFAGLGITQFAIKRYTSNWLWSGSGSSYETDYGPGMMLGGGVLFYSNFLFYGSLHVGKIGGSVVSVSQKRLTINLCYMWY